VKAAGGRPTSALITHIRKEIEAGKHPSGEFLPTVRELSKVHGLACSTVHRALKQLVAEGLIAAEPRQGYRVLAGSGRAERGCPLAYVFSREEYFTLQGSFEKLLLAAFQKAAARRGWTLLSALVGLEDIDRNIEDLKEARVGAVAVDSNNPEIIGAFQDAGFAVVSVNSWLEDMDVDNVVQDGQLGGIQAVGHLVERGHQRIGWFGMTDFVGHSMDRYSGAVAGMGRAGLTLRPDFVIGDKGEKGRAALRELLSRDERPTAMLALWQGSAEIVAGVAAELGLKLGEDIDVVSWTREEDYAETHLAAFKGGAIPAAVTWSVNQMAEAAVARVEERRRRPDLPTVRIKIPTRLMLGEGQADG
jgi:DNA-binding LacI/PurR family transcriptional regulator